MDHLSEISLQRTSITCSAHPSNFTSADDITTGHLAGTLKRAFPCSAANFSWFAVLFPLDTINYLIFNNNVFGNILLN